MGDKMIIYSNISFIFVSTKKYKNHMYYVMIPSKNIIFAKLISMMV